MMDFLQSTFPLLFNFELLENYGGRLISGLLITFQVVGLSCTLGFILAYPLCLGRMSRNRLLSGAVLSYVTFFRGTPLLCQLYLVYYGAGQIRPQLDALGLWWFFKEAFFCCIFAFTLNTAAYQSEIMRGALSAVPKGQREAAAALGLSSYAIARKVVWPQALLVAIRPLGNELISIIKASALAAIVTLLDLMGQTRFIFARTFDFSVYLYCAIIYLAMTEIIRRVLRAIEHRASPHLRAMMLRTEDAPAPRRPGVRRFPLPVRANEP
jgi:polar amino acid transport system permease protein